MIFIIGGKGFVGSAFVRLCENDNLEYTIITRDNYRSYIGQSCDVLINANGNSKKIIAEEDNLLDFEASVTSVKKSLLDFEAVSYVYLSSGDIYPNSTAQKTTEEDQTIDECKLSTYGFHKYLAELCVKQSAKKWWIFRLTGMVGIGLKKNAIYDLLHGDKLWLNPASKLQYINTDNVADIIMDVLQNSHPNQTFNLAGKGVIELSEVMHLLATEIQLPYSSQVLIHNINTEKIERYVTLPQSMKTVKEYIKRHLSQKSPQVLEAR